MHSNQVVRTEDGETWDETPWEVDVPPSCSVELYPFRREVTTVRGSECSPPSYHVLEATQGANLCTI